MISLIENNLRQLETTIQKLTPIEFTTQVSVMDNATIGQHCRHILELYKCLISGYIGGVVNYDNRERSYVLENNKEAAQQTIADIIIHLPKEDKDIIVEIEIDGHSRHITSTYYRELLYNVEHCIHHQALIKTAVNVLGLEVCDKNFGVAPSTIKYREEQCAH